jgi:hypothetical protein
MKFFFPILILFLHCLNLSEQKQGHWVSDGLKIGPIDSIIAVDSLLPHDTLQIKLVGGMIPYKPNFSHFENSRDSSRSTITVWVESFHWEGSNKMPPSDDRLTIKDSIILPPPFYPPHFIIKINQNNRSDLLDTIAIH